MATRMAEPITVRGRPSLEDTLARWLTENPKLLEEDLIEGSFGNAANPRLERILQGGKGPLLRKLLGIPEAEKQLFSFEQLKDILRDARKVPSLGEGQRALDAGFTGESKGQTVFDFPSPKAGRETLVDVPDALLSEAPPPDMVGPDIVPAPGPKLSPKARAVKGNRGLALVQDKLFGEKAWSESSRQARDVLSEAIEEVQDFNSQDQLKAFLRKRFNLSPDQVEALVAELGLPKGGVETVRGRAAGKLYELGQVHGSHFMAGTGGDDPKIAMRLTDEIRNRTGGMSHKDVARRAGQDVLTGMSPDEADKFIREEKSRGARAGRPTRAPYIRRELTEQYKDFPKTKTQQAVEDLLGKFDEAREKITMKPTELGAKADGPTMARWLKDKNEARAAYAAIDAQVGGDMALSNKLVAAIQERYPEITAQQLDTAMPRAMKKVYQGIANNREITAGHDVKPWELRRFSKKGHLLIGDTEVPLAQAIADANARHSDVSYLEASGMPHRKPTGERIPRPPFMGEELEAARRDARAAKRPPLEGPPREGAGVNELGRARLAKLKPTTDPAKAVPLDPRVKQVLGKRNLMRRIRESAADTDSAYAAALAQAQAQGKPPPTKQGVRAELAEKKDVDLTSDFDTFSESEKAARIENATYRKAQKAAERELAPRVPEGVRVASELRAGQGGLPPSSLAQVRKMARLAKGRMPEQFGDISLKGVEKPIAEWSPELRQTVDRIMKLATRRDAGVTRELVRAAMGIAKGDPEATVGMAAHVQKILKMLITKL